MWEQGQGQVLPVIFSLRYILRHLTCSTFIPYYKIEFNQCLRRTRFNFDYTYSSSCNFFFMSKSMSKLSLSLSTQNYPLLCIYTDDSPNDNFEYIYILSVNLIALCSFKIQGASGLRSSSDILIVYSIFLLKVGLISGGYTLG